MWDAFSPWRLVAAILSVVSLSVGAASAATVSVSGGTGASGLTIGPNYDREAVAVQFTIDADIHDYAISLKAFCSNCSGGFWLQRTSIGPGASILDSVGAVDAAGLLGPLTQQVTVFSGSTLAAGTYFLIFTVTQGTGGWLTGAPPILTEDGGSVGYAFSAQTASILGYQSEFKISVSRAELPEFSVTGKSGDVLAPVPLPASMWMVVIALLALASAARGLRLRQE